MTFMNILVAGLVAYDMFGGSSTSHSAADWAVVGLGAGTALPGVLKVISSKAVIGAIAEGAARVVAVAACAYAGYQTYKSFEKGDTVGAVLNLMSFVGSGLLAVSCFLGPFGAVLATVGGILVVISGVAAVVRDLMHPSTSRWWEAMVEAFEGGEIYKAVSKKAPALAAKVASLKAAMSNTTFLLVDPSETGMLKKYVDDDHVMMLLGSNSEPMEFPLGI